MHRLKIINSCQKLIHNLVCNCMTSFSSHVLIKMFSSFSYFINLVQLKKPHYCSRNRKNQFRRVSLYMMFLFSSYFNNSLNYRYLLEEIFHLVEGIYVVSEIIRFTERLLNTALTSSTDVSLVLNSLLFHLWVSHQDTVWKTILFWTVWRF